MVVDELGPIIRVEPKRPKREAVSRLIECRDHRTLALVGNANTFGPPGCHIHQIQSDGRVPAVRHQINLLEPRALIAPGRVGLDGNLLFEQAPRFRCSQTPRLRPLFGSRKPAVDGGWTHAQERRSLLLREPQCPLSFQRGNQIREPWRQALPADPAGGLGRDLQGADDLSGVGWPPPCTGQPGALSTPTVTQQPHGIAPVIPCRRAECVEKLPLSLP